MTLELSTLRQWLCLLASCVPLLGGCSDLAGTDAVSVSAINYSGRDLNGYLFEDPDNGKVAGGPGLNPYEGGGTMCCFSLPRKWHKRIKVKLRYDWWAGSSNVRDYQYVTVELPPYPTNEPGMLWALLYEDGSVEVIASAVDPGHPKWPGKIKHWPVPSREYKLKIWKEELGRLRAEATDYQRIVEKPSHADLESAWKLWNEYEKDATAGFEGPLDRNFEKAVVRRFSQSLRSVQEEISVLEARKP